MENAVMNNEYLSDLVLSEHSYVKTPNVIKSRYIKLPSRSLFKEKNELEDPLECHQNDSSKNTFSKYYTLAHLELQSFNNYFRCDPNTLYIDDSLNDLTGSNIHIELFDKATKIIKNYGCCVQQLYQKSGYTEASLRTYRIYTEYYGTKFMTLLLSSYEKKDIVSWLINALIQFLNESYFLAFFELLIYSKNQVPHLSVCIFYKNGVFRNDTNRSICENRYSLENFGKLIEMIWAPILPLPPSLAYNNNSLSIVLIPPIPFYVKSNMLEQDIESLMDDQIWFDRFVTIKRNISNIGRVLAYKTETIHSSQLNNEDTLRWWIDNLAFNLHSKISSLKTREPTISVILVGWLTGASLAYKLYVSNPKSIQCLVLINFPTFDVNFKTKRLSQEEIELIKCPILFITSTHSKVSNHQDIEEIRNSLNVPSALLIAESCDDLLLMNISEKIRLNMPQDLVDLKIIEAIREFISIHHSNRYAYDYFPHNKSRKYATNSDGESSHNESTSRVDSSQMDKSDANLSQRYSSSNIKQNTNPMKKFSDFPIRNYTNSRKNSFPLEDSGRIAFSDVGMTHVPSFSSVGITNIPISNFAKLTPPNLNILNDTKNQAVIKNIVFDY